MTKLMTTLTICHLNNNLYLIVALNDAGELRKFRAANHFEMGKGEVKRADSQEHT